MNKFWAFNLIGNGTGELILYGDISSETWYGDEITPRQFREDLDGLGDIEDLVIHINSGGGDVFAGQAIYSTLKQHKAHKTVYVDGIAASIASVIAMAGDTVIMPNNATMMIHNAWTLTAGNKHELRKMADTMEKIDESIVAVYAAKTKLAVEDIANMMDDETWLGAQEAINLGFADKIDEGAKVAASMDGNFLVYNKIKIDASRYRKRPEIQPKNENKPETEPPDEGGIILPANGGECQPVEDTETKAQTERIWAIRKKILEV